MMPLQYFYLILTVVIFVLAAADGIAAPGQSKIDDIVSISPERITAAQEKVVQADQMRRLGRYDQAENLYREALTFDRANTFAMIGLAICLADRSNLESAEALLDRALNIDPQLALAHTGKAVVLLNRLKDGETTAQKREEILAEAEREADCAASMAPASAEARCVLGTVYREQGRWREAAQELRVASTLDPQLSRSLAAVNRGTQM